MMSLLDMIPPCCDPDYASVITVSCTLCTLSFIADVHKMCCEAMRSKLLEYFTYSKTRLLEYLRNKDDKISPENGKIIRAFLVEVKRHRSEYEHELEKRRVVSKRGMVVGLPVCIAFLFFGAINWLTALVALAPLALPLFLYAEYWCSVRLRCFWRYRRVDREVKTSAAADESTVSIRDDINKLLGE